MEAILFTLVAVALYLVSDRVVDLVERRVGRRLEWRSLLFFAVILSLALAVFPSMRAMLGG